MTHNCFRSPLYDLNPLAETGASSIGIKVTLTSFTSAQISIKGQKSTEGKETTSPDSPSGAFEIYYKVLGSSESEWSLKPSFSSMTNDINQTVILDDLLCGSAYLLYVVELQSGSRSETVTFKTQGTGKYKDNLFVSSAW